MAKFLNEAKIDSSVSKLVETQTGYIFNGTFYDKKTLIAESLEDLVTKGGAKSLSLNRVASYPIIEGTSPDTSPLTHFRGDSVIKDDFEQDIYYSISFDYAESTKSANSYITKYKESEDEIKKIISSSSVIGVDGYYFGNIVQYIGQSKENLYFIADLSYKDSNSSSHKWNRSWICSVDKTTLVTNYIFEATKDRYSYNKLLETDIFIYLIYRLSNSDTFIIELNKDLNETRIIKNTSFIAEKITPNMTSDSMDGYIATASGSYSTNANYMPYRAFDGTRSSSTGWYCDSSSGWLRMQFPTPVCIKSMYLYEWTSHHKALPKEFTIEASDNGQDWDVLETFTDQSYNTGGKGFNFTNNKEYLYYQINASEPVSGSNVKIGEVEFYDVPYVKEIDRLHFTHEAVMVSDTKGYFIDTASTNESAYAKWYEFNLCEFSPAISENGIPYAQNLKKEADFILNDYVCYNSYNPCPLFDKDNISGTAHGNSSTFYWNNTSCYLDVTFNEEVNIWRAGCTSYANASYSNPFIIKKWKESTSTWDIITSSVTQKVNPINSTTWEKTIENLPEGRYRFEIENGKYRMDSCWYVEKATGSDYYTKRGLGIQNEDSVSCKNVYFNIECDTSNIKNIGTGSWRTVGESFITVVDGVKYYNTANFGLSTTEWNSTYAENSHITTFKIDEANKELTLTGQCQMSNAPQVCKSFAINKNGTKLVGLSKSNTFILQFNCITGKFEPLKYFAFDSWSCGFDNKDNIWILKKDMELLKINDSIPEKIEITFEDNSLDYDGTDIKTNIFIESLNYLNNKLSSKIALKINGQAVFDETNSAEIIVDTSELDKIAVPLTVKGSGMLMIYPTLILDIKEN